MSIYNPVTSESIYINARAARENQELGPLFEALCSTPPGDPARKTHVDQIVEVLAQTQVLSRWATGLSHRYGMGKQNSDDVYQLVAVAVVTRLHAMVEADVERISALYLQHLYQVGKSAITQHLGSVEWTGLSGATGLQRRKRLIDKVRRELVSEGVTEPTRQQIMDRSVQITSHLANAAKQGKVLTEADFAPTEVVTDDWSSRTESHETVESEIELRIEMADAVRALVAHMASKHPDDEELQAYTLSWTRLTYEGETPTTVRIAEDSGLSIARARAMSKKFAHEIGVFRESVGNH